MSVTFKTKAVTRALLATSLISVFLIEELAAKTYVVTTTHDFGVGSLREAITSANACKSESAIEFALTAGDPGYNCHSKSWCIHPCKALPTITVPITINGYSQPCSHPNRAAIDQENNAHIAIEICCPEVAKTNNTDGSCPETGLVFGPGSDGSCLRGLAINGFDRGVEIQSNDVRVSGMFLGVAVDGVTPKPNTVSLHIAQTASGTRVGGCKPKKRNLIAGNGQAAQAGKDSSSSARGAVTILGSHTTVEGTTINLSRKGDTVLLPYAFFGIVSSGNSGSSFGGDVVPKRVIVAGHSESNILLDSTIDDTIENLLVGTAIDGKTALGGRNGLRIINTQSLKKRDGRSENNVHNVLNSIFSGHSETGIVLGEPYSENMVDGTYLYNTYFGTDITGNAKVPNGLHGLVIETATRTNIDSCVLCHNKLHGLFHSSAAQGTILKNSNTSFNGLAGIDVEPLEESATVTADDQYSVQLKGNTAVSNGNNAFSAQHISIEQL